MKPLEYSEVNGTTVMQAKAQTDSTFFCTNDNKASEANGLQIKTKKLFAMANSSCTLSVSRDLRLGQIAWQSSDQSRGL